MLKLVLGLLLLFCMNILTFSQKLYDELGVPAGSTQQEIRRHYRKLSLKYHPDKNPPEKRAELEAEFVKIANAYRVLSDPERRNRYDLYGTVDGGEFTSFNDAFSAQDVEDSPLNWALLIFLCGSIIIPILIQVTKKKTKKVGNRQQKALQKKLEAEKAKANKAD